MGAKLGQAIGGRARGGGDDLVEAHEINVTPFIDVMLVLLIIFMVAAPLATVNLGVDLPASAVEPAPRPDKPVFVTVKPDLSVAVGEDIIARDTLTATSTVASGAATMKMISSTSITSMNGVTLISESSSISVSRSPWIVRAI